VVLVQQLLLVAIKAITLYFLVLLLLVVVMVESVIKVIQMVFLAVMVVQAVVAQEPNSLLVVPQVQETKVDIHHLKEIMVEQELVLQEILLVVAVAVLMQLALTPQQ
jgi:hypothetical protein